MLPDDTRFSPEIVFKSRGVKKTGENSGDITGDFTMHGVTRPMTLHVKLGTPAMLWPERNSRPT